MATKLNFLPYTYRFRINHKTLYSQTFPGPILAHGLSANGLSYVRYEAIIWTSAGLLTGPLGANFSGICTKVHIFKYKKCVSKCRLQHCGYFVSVSKWNSLRLRGSFMYTSVNRPPLVQINAFLLCSTKPRFLVPIVDLLSMDTWEKLGEMKIEIKQFHSRKWLWKKL